VSVAERVSYVAERVYFVAKRISNFCVAEKISYVAKEVYVLLQKRVFPNRIRMMMMTIKRKKIRKFFFNAK
jgi:hypothetical protein